ncbi:MAG: pilus assembly protein [Gammaproteobacteria bacterium]|nr:pilus assembly protein [Gammaproteobacteria bacterium]
MRNSSNWHLQHSLSNSRQQNRGQGMTEYIIIVALIAIAAIAAVGFFGSTVKAQFVAMGSELLGENGGEAIEAVNEVREAQVESVAAQPTLNNYGN